APLGGHRHRLERQIHARAVQLDRGLRRETLVFDLSLDVRFGNRRTERLEWTDPPDADRDIGDDAAEPALARDSVHAGQIAKADGKQSDLPPIELRRLAVQFKGVVPITVGNPGLRDADL